MTGLQALQHLADTRAALRMAGAPRRARLATDSRRVQPATPSSPGRATRSMGGSTSRRWTPAPRPAWSRPRVVASAFGTVPMHRWWRRGLKARTGEIADEFYAGRARAGGGGHHRHQRQDLDRLVDGAGAAPAGPALRVIGTLGVGEPPAGLQFTGLTTPDPVTVQQSLRRFADQGFRRLRDRSLVDRRGRAPPGRHAFRGGAVHQLHAGPPRLPRQHGGLLGRQARAVRLAGPARRGDQPRRPRGDELAAPGSAAPRPGPTAAARCAAARRAHRLPAPTAGWASRWSRARRARRAQRADRRIQRRSNLLAVIGVCAPGRAAGRGGRAPVRC